MRIDRHRFLLLTASISGGACASNAPSAVPAEHVAEAPPEATQTEPSDDPPSEVAVSEADAGTAAGSPVSEMGGPAGEWSPPPSAPVSLSSDKKCNDNIGKVGACTFKAPGPVCESFGDLPTECKMIAKALKPKVAARAIDCIKQKSGTPAICEFGLAARCAADAIRNGVCPGKAADAPCQQAVSLCSGGRGGSPLSMDECRAAYSAVQQKSKKALISCVSEFCSIDCLYQL
jgi:hypothetical protein